MRIISGQFKGRRLQSFKGSNVRPTADRVREALFNILGRRPISACVLDLFSGTGALGIEALSRGAAMAVFIDSSARALTVLRKNLDFCDLRQRARAIHWDIAENLDCLNLYPRTFNLVFLDPPYNQELVPIAIKHLVHSQSLMSGAMLVAEHEARKPLDPEAIALDYIETRRYGRTGLSFFSYQPA